MRRLVVLHSKVFRPIKWASPSQNEHASNFLATSFLSLVALVLCLFAMPLAWAIGDSGGCGDPLSGPLGQALKSGGAADAEREIVSWVSREENGRGAIAKAFATESQKTQWRKQRIREVIEGVHEKSAICRPGALLGTALRAGNIEVVRYLTGTPLGVNPKIPKQILFACSHDYSENDELRVRRRQAFELVLRTGQVDMNLLDNDGRTILQSCYEPELITLFAEYGARLDVVDQRGYNLLDRAVESAVSIQEDSSAANSLHALESAKVYARLVSASIQGRAVEKYARYACNTLINGERNNPKSCKALSEFIKAEAGTFGGAKGW